MKQTIKENKIITIYLNDSSELKFKGYYLPKRQTENWHYYYDVCNDAIIHIRKDYIVYVKEENITDYDYTAFNREV